MAFTQLTNDLTTIEQLPDTPNRTSGYTAQQMKEAFDANAKIIKTYINETLLAELQSDGATSGYSGAKNIAVSSRSEFLTYRNIEDVLIYYRELIREAVSGEIGDDDIKTRMLDKSVGNEAVTTETIRNNAVTNAKLAGGISEDKIISLPTTKLTGTITNNQLAGGTNGGNGTWYDNSHGRGAGVTTYPFGSSTFQFPFTSSTELSSFPFAGGGGSSSGGDAGHKGRGGNGGHYGGGTGQDCGYDSRTGGTNGVANTGGGGGGYHSGGSGCIIIRNHRS